MKRSFGMVLITGLWLLAAGWLEKTAASGHEGGGVPVVEGKPLYVAGEVLLRRAPGVLAESTNAALEALGATVRETFPDLGVDRVQLPETMTVDDAVATLAKDQRFSYVQPNYRYYVDKTPNDTAFLSEQWGLHNSGQTVNGILGITDADIDAPEAWDLTQGSPAVVVAVIDTGIDPSQQDLIENLWTNPDEGGTPDGVDNDGNGYIDDLHGWDFRFNDADPDDGHSHGSHVSGIIGASGNNGYGITGVCWDVSIMPLKVANAEGEADDVDIIRALIYAHQKDAKVINISMGGYGFSQAMQDAVDLNSQAVVVCAAGNGASDGVGDNNDLFGVYPASLRSANIVSVAASDPGDYLAVFSNFGPSTVDIAAPGVNILSTINETGGYGFMDGTSMAAPMVSGTAALMLSAASLSPGQVIQILLHTVDVKSHYKDLMTSSGRLNAQRAVAGAVAEAEKNGSDGDGGACFISTVRP